MRYGAASSINKVSRSCVPPPLGVEGQADIGLGTIELDPACREQGPQGSDGEALLPQSWICGGGPRDEIRDLGRLYVMDIDTFKLD